MDQPADGKNQIRVSALLITLLQGVPDVGFKLTFSDTVTQMALAMAESSSLLQQQIATELIVETTSKHDRAKSIVATGIPVLKKLLASKDDGIRARALVVR